MVFFSLLGHAREHAEPAQAGKTSVLYCLQDAVAGGSPAPRPPPQPTVGLNLGAVELGGARLTLWDVGGAAALRRLWPDYYAEAQAVAFVVDAGDRARWAEAAQALQAALGARWGEGGRPSRARVAVHGHPSLPVLATAACSPV